MVWASKIWIQYFFFFFWVLICSHQWHENVQSHLQTISILDKRSWKNFRFSAHHLTIHVISGLISWLQRIQWMKLIQLFSSSVPLRLAYALEHILCSEKNLWGCKCSEHAEAIHPFFFFFNLTVRNWYKPILWIFNNVI